MAQKQNTDVKNGIFRLDLYKKFFKPIKHQVNAVQHHLNAWGKNTNII